MVKWSAVIVGFILAIMVKSYFPHYEFIGLILVGFLVGVIAKRGFWGGMGNAAVAGALGTIVSAIIFILIITTGSTLLLGLFGGLAGFTISGLSSAVVILGYLIYYMIVMGIAGGIGGLVAGHSRDKY
jgi:hypothetical protein